MEQLLGKAKNGNNNAFSDPVNRMPQRSRVVKSGQGVGFQELGSSFGPANAALRAYEQSYKPKTKPMKTDPPVLRKKPLPISEDESDDELLLSSQNSVTDNASPSSKRVAKGKKRYNSSDDGEIILVGGRTLKAHPHYKPSSVNALKGLRFSKNTKNTSVFDGEADAPPPSSSLTASQDLLKPISDEIEILDGSPPPARPSRQKPSKTRRRIPGATCPTTRRLPDTKSVSTFKPPSASKDGPQSPPKPRPRPRMIMKHATSRGDSSPESTPRPATRTFPRHSELPTNAEERTLQKPRTATLVYTPKPIPLPSPLGAKPVSRASTFPELSPLSSPKVEGNRDHGVTGLGRRAVPRPFPMSPQMFADIERRSKSPSSKSTKRASSDDSDAEQGPTAKKHKDSRSGILDSYDYLNEDDSLELGYDRDPSTLCPYCDEQLPPRPTAHLQHLLAMARKKSKPDARPRNRGGLRAPLTVYISVCQRHRFESHQLPIAAQKGWPTTIDFVRVPERVRAMKNILEGIILDKDDAGPRSQSVFWGEVKQELKKQGSRAMVGVKGQFATFEKTQPGYYGEQGFVIIHQTLFDLFPPSKFDASLISPLAPVEFIQRVLVPEVAARLIAEDLCLDMKTAITTLRDSVQYGVAMFPDAAETKRKGDANKMGVADRIVMERARARRKEIDEEEKVEKAMLEEQRAAYRAKAWAIRREKAMERTRQIKARTAEGMTDARDVEASDATDASEMRLATKRQNVAADSESDAMSVDSLASRRPARIAKKAARNDGAKEVKATPRSNSSDHDEVGVDKPKRKAIVTTNKTKKRSGAPVKEALGTNEQKKPFGGFAVLDSGEEHESTPRPVRQRSTDAGTPGSAENTVNGLGALVCPLQSARNRFVARPIVADDGWSRSLRTNVPDGADSDTSNATRRSQRLARQAIKKHNKFDWLFSDTSESEST